MNTKVVLLSALVATLVGCSTVSQQQVDTVRNEELSENFVAENIKVTSKGCDSIGTGNKCTIVGIDSTSTAPSNGGSENNRKTALEAACAFAKANALHMLQGERVDSSRTVERQATGIEISESGEVQTSDLNSGSQSQSNRQNSNNINFVVTNTIRMNSKGFMEGWMVTNQEVIGPQEVSCTVSWSLKNQNLVRQFKTQK